MCDKTDIVRDEEIERLFAKAVSDTPETDVVKTRAIALFDRDREGALFMMIDHSKELERQRNELLAMLKKAEPHLYNPYAPADFHAVQKEIAALIAKVKG